LPTTKVRSQSQLLLFDNFICRCCATLYHFDGIYRKFYWLFFVIYLALHFSLKTEKAHHELDGYDVRYFHHIFGHYFWFARHVLFRQSSKKGFCSRSSCINQPKLLLRQSHLQFQRRIQQENLHLPLTKVRSQSQLPCLTILFAIVVPHFTILIGLIGNFTGCFLSFIWPCIFHLKLRRHTLSWMVMMYDIFIIFLGLLGMYYSRKALKKAFVLGVPV
jgi:hypothetical protein